MWLVLLWEFKPFAPTEKKNAISEYRLREIIAIENTPKIDLPRGSSAIQFSFKALAGPNFSSCHEMSHCSGISTLPDFKPNFPSWKENKLSTEAKNLDESGVDLLQKTLIYDPAKR